VRKVKVSLTLRPDEYTLLRALAAKTGKSYGEILVDLIMGNAIDNTCTEVTVYEFFKRFADAYLRYILTRKVFNEKPCDSFRREEKFLCMAFESVMNRFIQGLGVALKEGALKPKDLIEIK